MARQGSKRPAGAATTSARPATARSNRSCSMASTKLTRARRRRRSRRSGTATSAAPATTTEQRRSSMLVHPTHNRLVALGLIGMAKALEEQRKQPDVAALDFDERLALLVDRETTERENKRLASRLRFAGLALARGDGRHERLLKSLARVELLILDDWGLAPMAAERRRDLLEIMEDRHARGSTIVTSQLPVENWHDSIGDPTIADAILDRLVHNAHRLTLKGESLRKAA